MTKEAPPSRTAPQFVVRLPDEQFREQIAEAAKANGRSMNAEIVDRLQRSFVAGEEAATLRQSLNSQTALISMLGYYISELAGQMPGKSEQSKRLYEHLKAMGSAMHARDFSAAVEMIHKINKLNKEIHAAAEDRRITAALDEAYPPRKP